MSLNLKLYTVLLFLACSLMTRCGPTLDAELVEEEEEKAKTSQTETSTQPGELAGKETVEIQVRVEIEDSDGLALTGVTAATSYSVDLVGCASGFTETSSTTLAPYKFDVGCYAKLTQFVYGGYTYNQTDGGAVAFTPDNITGYETGDQAVFGTATGGVPADEVKLRVYIEKQLSDPIAAGDSVIYRFSHIEKGADETVLKSTIDQAGTTVTDTSVAPPSFTIFSTTLVNITAGGAGEWEIVFQCSATISGSGNDRVCEEVDMFDNLRMKLVQDTFSSNPTVTDLETAFGVLAGSGSPVATGDIHDAATTTTNGGFKSPNTGEANVLTGPDAMHSNPNMILILRSEDPVTAGEYSWQFFNLDVNTGG